jgi:hypothetical protein
MSIVIDGRDISKIFITPESTLIKQLQPNGKPKKKIVITVSRNFFKGHPRAGEETGFKDALVNGLGIKRPDYTGYLKLHTIRAGEYWKKVVEKVNAGTHVLCLRQWSGLPYKSKQVEFMQIEKLGYQEFEFKYNGDCMTPYIDGCPISPDKLHDVAENDGLKYDDFLAWFKYPKPFKGLILHFTDLRY